MCNPLVSVVIPVFNGQDFLEDALRSVFGQDYQAREIIVVDDGSADRSVEIALACRDIRLIRQDHQGVAVARNTGLAASAGEFIAFLDQDDLWAPDKLSRQVSHFLALPEMDCLYTAAHHFLEPGTCRPAWFRPNLVSVDQAGYYPSSLLVRRDVFQRIGVFDPSFLDTSDVDWLTRAKDAGLHVCIMPEVLMHKRIHSNNASARIEGNQQGVLKALAASLARRRQQGS